MGHLCRMGFIRLVRARSRKDDDGQDAAELKGRADVEAEANGRLVPLLAGDQVKRVVVHREA